nr:ABC transporter permease [uncultured Criibacterium sp.]
MENTKKIKKKSLWAETWHRLKKSKLAMFGLYVLLALIILALLADFIYDYDTDVIEPNYSIVLQEPSSEHWFGTDNLGRDVFARVIYGSRISLKVSIMSIVISLIIGGGFGAVAGYYGGRVDDILMRIMDVFLAIPNMLMAIAVVASLGPSMFNLMLAIAISNIPRFARIVRASILGVKDEEFVEAARACGATNTRIIIREVLPNCMAPIIVQGSIAIASSILIIASLSFVGLGVTPPTPEWGSMLSEGRTYIRDSNYLTIFPGLAIAITSLSINLLGDGLRDALDPKLKR